MNILLLTDGITPFTTGGIQKHSAMLAKLLTINDHTVTLVHCVDQNRAIPSSEVVNQSIFENESSHSLKKIIGLQFPQSSKVPGHYIRSSKKYSKSIFEIVSPSITEFDFIYAQGFTAYEFISQKKSYPKIPPIFSNLHGLEMFQKAASLSVKLQHYLLRPIAKSVCIGSNYTFSFGGQITEILKKIRVNEGSILECSHGITSDWLFEQSINEEEPLISFIFIGRYERRKGIEELNQVLIQLVKSHDFNFKFIGDIPLEKQVVHPHIKYHGKITNYLHLKEYLQLSDVLICPSYSEGMPTVIFEAMATKNAIIATDVGAVNQQVSTKNGWLLPSSKIDLLKKAMIDAIQIPKSQLKEKKEQSFLLTKEKFIWEQVIKQKINLIQAVISKNT